MTFAILRHAKISSSTKGTAIAHNHRHTECEQINIDPALKKLNQYFFGEGAKDRIDALLPKKMRKDAIVSVEVLLTASPEFFDSLEKDREKLAVNPGFLEWVQETKKWAESEFGKNLADLVLHMDESTPHFHALAVPLTKDGRLCAKEITARSEMQRRQTDYAKAMDKFGLKRGEPAIETKRRHIGLKESAGSGGQGAKLAAEILAANAELKKTQMRFERLQKTSMNDVLLISELRKKAKKMEEFMTADQKIGIEWWNNLEPAARKRWLDEAGSAVAADAWATFKKWQQPEVVKTAVEPVARHIGPNERARLRTLAAKAAAAAPETAPEPLSAPDLPNPPTLVEKTALEAFLELYGHIKAVAVNLIDGMRLDASEARLGLFSVHSSETRQRIQVLCEVPQSKVMPKLGELFDVKAVPGRSRSVVEQ